MLSPGTHVTNDKGWWGTVKRVEDCTTCPDGKYYRVYWEERAKHKNKLVAKQPIIGHTIDQLKLKTQETP